VSINRLPDYLDHMQQAASDALSFVEGVSREESHIKAWRAAGYHVSLFFLALPDAAVAVARVAERVRQGGHDVPE
jgi:predicted ABC-type ATPase